VIAKARDYYAHPDTMPAELRKSILYVVASHADATTWDKLHTQAKAETTPLIKDELYSLLSTSEDETLAKRALDLALTPEPGATTSAGMISGVSRRHPDLAFDFAVAHRTQVDKLVDSSSSSRYYPGLGRASIDPAMIGKIEAYCKSTHRYQLTPRRRHRRRRHPLSHDDSRKAPTGHRCVVEEKRRVMLL
jgi:hypothetical protein